jgi:hypothetical protein
MQSPIIIEEWPSLAGGLFPESFVRESSNPWTDIPVRSFSSAFFLIYA